MLLLLHATAGLAAPTIHLTATDPSGATLLDVEEVLPYETTLVSGKAALSLFAASYHGHRAVLELAAGRATRDGVRVKAQTSIELDPGVPAEAAITWKKITFRTRTVLSDPDLPVTDPGTEPSTSP